MCLSGSINVIRLSTYIITDVKLIIFSKITFFEFLNYDYLGDKQILECASGLRF